MINTLYLPELREMLELGDVEGLHEFCIALHPARTAEFMEGLTASESWTVLQTADPAEFLTLYQSLSKDPSRAARLRRAGRSTALQYAWPAVIEQNLKPWLSLAEAIQAA